MINKRLKVGIAGYGVVGKRRHQFMQKNAYLNVVAVCDKNYMNHNMPCIITSDKHTRCLDRVAEAINNSQLNVSDTDIIVCVQGDEPMLHPDMIEAVITPLTNNGQVNATVLGMDIIDKSQFENPNIVKIITNCDNDVLYTSRSPIPYCQNFFAKINAKRIYGIFAFRWHFLKTFNNMNEFPLEKLECCDSNRFCDNGLKQRVANYPYRHSFSIDTPNDKKLVEQHIEQDPLWSRY